ncbi:MAG: ATP-binding protein [Ilumatobacteraceae bacterium]|nr:ATP-binding protein [Ilumatobacteraceae bacterium]
MEVTLKTKAVMTLDATPDPRVLEVLSNFPLAVSHCFAEIIDNSIDNLKQNDADDGHIDITIENGVLRFIDNGSGMDVTALEKSVKAGSSDKSKYSDLGLFGVGFNIATSKLGDVTTIYTKQAKSSDWYSASLNIRDLIRNKTYLYECNEVELPSVSQLSGTIIEIQLKNESAADLSRKSSQKKIREQLGEIYSYMIRPGVPGLSGDVAGAKLPVSITFQGEPIVPKLPCIWNESRTTSNGDAAVIKIDEVLVDRKLCENCGHWELPQTNICSQCSSTDIVLVERKIWGWLGIQRYIHTDHYGITYLRNGRAIDVLNKEVFKWHDPNSNRMDNEYPIEMPANRGRIVGEIHCSHCSVSPSKDRFDPTDPSFIAVINQIRGLEPLKPNTVRGSVNKSPLNKLYKPFRRNDPGLGYLVPGDGAKANHDQSANWAKKFYDGEPEWQSDNYWYQAAKNHDKIKAAGKVGASDGGVNATVPVPIPGGKPGASTTATTGQKAGQQQTPKRKTLREKENEWQSAGAQRSDLSFTFNLENKSWEVKAYETWLEIRDDNEVEHSAFINPGAGRALTAYVNMDSDLVRKFGRNTTDLLLLEVASYVHGEVASPSLSITDIYSKLLQNLPDEEFSQPSLIKKISALRAELRRKSKPIFAANSADFLSLINPKNLEIIKTEHSSISPTMRWEELAGTGGYVDFMNFSGFAEVLKERPLDFFDGKFFSANWSSQTKAQQRVLTPILDTLNELERLSGVSTWNDYEKSTVDTALKHLHAQLV